MAERDAIEFDYGVLFKAFDKSVAGVLDGAIAGVHDVVGVLLDESREEAPLDKGTLRMTAGTNVEFDGDAAVTGEVFYSAVEEGKSGRVNYAVILHELGEEFKNPSTPGTRPKWLERPLKRNKRRFNFMMAAAIRRGMRK